MATNNELERELGVEREKAKQIKKTSDMLNSDMKHELLTVESRFQDLLHRNTMIGEDFRTQAWLNLDKYKKLLKRYNKLE